MPSSALLTSAPDLIRISHADGLAEREASPRGVMWRPLSQGSGWLMSTLLSLASIN